MTRENRKRMRTMEGARVPELQAGHDITDEATRSAVIHRVAPGRDGPAPNGRCHQIDFDALDDQSLREPVRLVPGVDHEKQAVASMMPWR